MTSKDSPSAKDSPTSNSSTPANKRTHLLPVPALFVGPPSRNASNTSLALAPSSSRVPLSRQRSLLAERTTTAPHDAPPGPRQAQQQEAEQRQQGQRSNERIDAMWAEMQSTLSEVELSASAGAGGVHVFGPEHSRALDELRAAQIALAQAWARREGEEQEEDADDGGGEAGNGKGEGNGDKERPLVAADMLAGERSSKVGSNGGMAGGVVGIGRPRSGTNRSTKSNTSERTQLEEDTEKDILLARERREANDRYFRKVNAGVLDVVAKLEEVARVMKGVERESKEIWGDRDSIDIQAPG